MSVNTKVNGQLVKSAGLYSVSTPIGMADIYSTEEKEVGLWKNNKPLYQKTIVIGNGDVNVNTDSGNGTYRAVVDSGISNIDEGFAVVDKSFMILSSDSSPRYFAWIDYQGKGSSQFVVYTNASRTNVTVVLTIQYTKTTDTPWSGKFVPQGYGYVSSGDIYSFEERQVGVWTDGKPLYQKTLYFDGTVPKNTWTDHNISDVDKIWVYDAFGKRSSDYRYNGINYFGSDDYMAMAINRTQIYIAYPTQTVMTNDYITVRYTKTTDTTGGEYIPSVGGGTDLITTLAEMGITATFVGDYSEMYNDFNHIVRLKDDTMNGQGVYFTNNQHFGGVDLPLTLAVRARKGMIQIGYGTGTLPTMITEGTGRTQFRNIPAGGFDTITIPYGSVGFIGKYFVSEDASKECVFEIGI